MQESSRRAPGEAASPTERFDGDSVRRILQRAAKEQHRLDNEFADSYSLEELQEMAADVRISPEALGEAISAHRRHRVSAAARTRAPELPDERQHGWIAALEDRLPESWSPDMKSAVLAGSGFVALTAALLSLWAVAPTFFWIIALSLTLLSLLVLIGASPF